jgi:hypothetical protein
MRGRKKKPRIPIYSDLIIQTTVDKPIRIKNIAIRCPICESNEIGTNGTQQRGDTRITGYKCHNPECPFRIESQGGKQFTLFSSMFLEFILKSYLDLIISKLFHSHGKLSDIARDYGISPSLMNYLYKKLQNNIDRVQGLQNLVDQAQKDYAIAIDETFLTINGKSFYIIMATGYTSHKILGLKVSKTRSMGDIRDVFLEADRNTLKPISIITADAWNGTRALARYLDRPITIVIHKHKKPYEKVVIIKYHYDSSTRFVTTIGLKSDFCKKRGSREYYYLESSEPRYPAPKKKRGRPKGAKGGQKKQKRKARKKLKRGRKGLFVVFDRGKRGYAKVDPHRITVRVGRDISKPVAAGIEDVVKLFPKSFIQNNLAEHKNSVLSNYLVLSGPKTAETVERRLRAFLICHNNPKLLEKLEIHHFFQKKFLVDQIRNSPLRYLWLG